MDARTIPRDGSNPDLTNDRLSLCVSFQGYSYVVKFGHGLGQL